MCRVSLMKIVATTAPTAATAPKTKKTEFKPQAAMAAPTTLGPMKDAMRDQQALVVMPMARARVG